MLIFAAVAVVCRLEGVYSPRYEYYGFGDEHERGFCGC